MTEHGPHDSSSCSSLTRSGANESKAKANLWVFRSRLLNSFARSQLVSMNFLHWLISSSVGTLSSSAEEEEMMTREEDEQGGMLPLHLLHLCLSASVLCDRSHLESLICCCFYSFIVLYSPKNTLGACTHTQMHGLVQPSLWRHYIDIH